MSARDEFEAALQKVHAKDCKCFSRWGYTTRGASPAVCDSLRQRVRAACVPRNEVLDILERLAPLSQDHGDCEHCKQEWAAATLTEHNNTWSEAKAAERADIANKAHAVGFREGVMAERDAHPTILPSWVEITMSEDLPRRVFLPTSVEAASERATDAELEEAKELIDSVVLRGWQESPDYNEGWRRIRDLFSRLRAERDEAERSLRSMGAWKLERGGSGGMETGPTERAEP